MATERPRAWWQNCAGADDEVRAIDAREDALGPLDEPTTEIRRLITGFEACYHEADKEAEFIVAAIGAGCCPQRSNERPPQRRRELEHARDILSAWCENSAAAGTESDVGGIRAGDLRHFLGEPSSLKLWQVARVVDRVSHALTPDYPCHNLVLNVGEHGEPGADVAGEHYANHTDFLRQTRETIIHDTVDGRQSKVSLAFAIDLLMPCGWDFAGCLVTILKAIGGDLHPQRPLACCARNIKLSPLCGPLTTISNTLNAFWRGETPPQDTDEHVPVSLGAPTPVKRWLAASLDKTIRLHLSQPFEMDLF
jgi:hypothetical protein